MQQSIRAVFKFYYYWYNKTSYTVINPLVENLYWYQTWRYLRSTFHEIDKPTSLLSPQDFLSIIDQCRNENDVYSLVVARRLLGGLYSTSDLDAAREQFETALEESGNAGLDAEIGHLHRDLGYRVFRAQGRLKEAAAEFERALAHEEHPLFSYWYALSARELGDCVMRMATGSRPADDLRQLQLSGAILRDLQAGLGTYRSGRERFDLFTGCEVLPIARAAEQQMFRSYVDNAVQVAMLCKAGSDVIAEIEASGPRYATDIVAEGVAARKLGGANAFADYQRSRAVVHASLARRNEGSTLEEDFPAYLESVTNNRDLRQFYLRTRNALSVPIAQAERSDELAKRLLSLHVEGVAFLFFHVARKQTFATVVDSASGDVAVLSANCEAREWELCHEAYRNAMEMACSDELPEALRERGMCSALDLILGSYQSLVGDMFAAALPMIRGKHVKIFPRFSMNAVPLHAVAIGGKALAQHCDVSYAQTLGMFFQLHATTPDPSMMSARLENPQTWNRYSYALNNPLIIVDPTGEEWNLSGNGQFT
jgi:hypothetical protein